MMSRRIEYIIVVGIPCCHLQLVHELPCRHGGPGTVYCKKSLLTGINLLIRTPCSWFDLQELFMQCCSSQFFLLWHLLPVNIYPDERVHAQ
jgi:hypothetical protein